MRAEQYPQCEKKKVRKSANILPNVRDSESELGLPRVRRRALAKGEARIHIRENHEPAADESTDDPQAKYSTGYLTDERSP